MNPQALEGQIEGGTAQGLGLALFEEIQIKDGRVLNASFTDYLLPTILDMPPMRIEILEHPDPEAPYGLKGVGEPPHISTPPAVVAAVRAASGRPLTRIPVRPEHIVGLEPAGCRSPWPTSGRCSSTRRGSRRRRGAGGRSAASPTCTPRSRRRSARRPASASSS